MLNSLAFYPIKKMNQQVIEDFKKPYMKHADLQFYMVRKIILKLLHKGAALCVIK